MDLAAILDLCQNRHREDWRRVPGGPPGTDLQVGLLDIGSSGEPALTTLAHNYWAVYARDPRVTFGWGMESDDWPRGSGNPDWADAAWDDVLPQWANILLNGAVIWRMRFAYINRGAGADGYMPWLREDRESVPNDPTRRRRIGWSTTRWEMSFAQLLNDLQGNTWDFDVERERAGKALVVRDQSPLE